MKSELGQGRFHGYDLSISLLIRYNNDGFLTHSIHGSQRASKLRRILFVFFEGIQAMVCIEHVTCPLTYMCGISSQRQQHTGFWRTQQHGYREVGQGGKILEVGQVCKA